MTATRWVIGGVIVAIAAIAAIFAIATGDSEESAGARVPDNETMAEFRDCLSQHGAELPEPPAEGEMPDPPAQGETRDGGQLQPPPQPDSEAFDACRDLAPQGAPGAPPGATPQN